MHTRSTLTTAGLLGLAALLCASCGDGKAGSDPDVPGVERATDDSPSKAGAKPAEPDPIEPLADGSHGVYGLRVPVGMKPGKGPHKVFRFEGTMQLLHLKRYVMRQVETGTIIEEPTGYLIRKARVLEPVGSPDPGLRLAVRIFRGRKGGASMDVWVEIDSLAAQRGGSHGLGGGAGTGEDRPRPKLSSTQAAARAEQRKQTFELLQQQEQGQGAPRGADPENPLFY
jgi:hypothetical protein